MSNTFKIAKWEIKKNLKNKSFLIGLFITPIIFLAFMIIPSFFSDSEAETVHVFVKDELGVYPQIEAIVDSVDYLDWELTETDFTKEEMIEQVEVEENTAFILLAEESLATGLIPIYINEEVDSFFINEAQIIEEPLRYMQLEQLGLSETELDTVSRGIALDLQVASDQGEAEDSSSSGFGEESELLKRIIPGAFAGIILFSIVISGMMVFQSASQEKKDKIAEIILSSVSPNELMQGKIFGYFALGIIQVFVWLGVALPVVIWKLDMPIIEYLLVPELAVLLLIAILGYLMFAAIFVGLGATMEDVSTSGNFQGFIMMIPFLPFILLGPILTNPSGIVAQVGSYIPLTSPGILIIRLSMLEEWPWIEISIAIAILIISVWAFMRLAGKVFQTGILLYGKNATPKEIWRWLRS